MVPLLRTGIAWPSDRNIKFRNPEGDLETELRGYARPKAWSRDLWELDTIEPSNNGFQVTQKTQKKMFFFFEQLS